MLTFNLKKEWYDKIKSGEKTIEYREVKSYWIWRLIKSYLSNWKRKDNLYENLITFTDNEDFYNAENCFILTAKEEGIRCNIPCRFVLGYTKEHLDAEISYIEIVDGKDTDLHTDKDVYAIHFKLL